MTHLKIEDLWEIMFKDKEEVTDYAGRKISRAALNNSQSELHPTITYIRPLSLGGKDVAENIVICHTETSQEKAESFPTWTANGKAFQAKRVMGYRNEYDIYEMNNHNK